MSHRQRSLPPDTTDASFRFAPKNVDEWLSPGDNTAQMQQILDDHERPYCEHRLAAGPRCEPP
jgi:hypothetical protein